MSSVRPVNMIMKFLSRHGIAIIYDVPDMSNSAAALVRTCDAALRPRSSPIASPAIVPDGKFRCDWQRPRADKTPPLISTDMRAAECLRAVIGSIEDELPPALCVFGRCHYARRRCPGVFKLVALRDGIRLFQLLPPICPDFPAIARFYAPKIAL